MDPFSEELRQAVNVAQVFVSVTLSNEKLTVEAEKERQLLSEWLVKLRTKMGEQPPGQAEAGLPPRPPKGPTPVTTTSPESCQEPEEIYDDVNDAENDAENYEEMDPERTSQESVGEEREDYEIMDEGQVASSEEVPKDTPAEDYEVMADPPHPPALEKRPGDVVQDDNYEVPGQEDQENYEEPERLEPSQEEANYEVTDAGPAGESQVISTSEPFEESMYEGIEPTVIEPETPSTPPAPPGRDRTGTVQLESLKSPIKPEDIVDKIMEGFLFKDRTVVKHRLFGGRWQKRYVVVRDYALYYYKNKPDKEQRGTILLPGYSVAQCKNKDKEFELTVKEGRTYKFMVESKDEIAKWMNAIKKAANAKLSDRQSKVLDELRSKDSSCDEDSLHYEGVDTKGTNLPPEPDEDLYDDVGGVVEADYEITETAPPPRPAHPAHPAQEEEYEIATEANQEAEQEYEVAEQVPPRPGKPQQQEPVGGGAVKAEPIQEDEYEVAPDTPPASKPQPPLPPVSEPHPSPLPPRPHRPGKSAKSEEGDESPEQPPRPGAKPVLPPPPEKKLPLPTPQAAKDEPTPSAEPVIDYANVYMAKWNCKADEDNELEFSRGDLLYIYEKPHEQWWVGSLFKPQGHKVGLLPSQYVMEAYNL